MAPSNPARYMTMSPAISGVMPGSSPSTCAEAVFTLIMPPEMAVKLFANTLYKPGSSLKPCTSFSSVMWSSGPFFEKYGGNSLR